MNKVEELSIEKKPTALANLNKEDFSLQKLDNFLLDNLSGRNYELFKEGKVNEGNKNSNSLNIIKSILHKELEIRKLESEENTYILTKIEKSLENIFDIVESYNTEQDVRYFILGTILKSLLYG